ncbi:hypothetical protein CEV32_2161 [Brucella rhizosphaerae]|uniref:Uncharacterized protein n=1 Tax=Brucella rhizosphaerae TaxID=571254 RepID=A0A256F4R4_9HYPH|nr:hypothetical protein CEV32_2161 [Brucella rhizosphaerae]
MHTDLSFTRLFVWPVGAVFTVQYGDNSFRNMKLWRPFRALVEKLLEFQFYTGTESIFDRCESAGR